MINETIKSKAILVGIITDKNTSEEVEKSLAELERLLDTAGGEVFAYVTQNKQSYDPRTLIGSGKVQEIVQTIRRVFPERIIFFRGL